MACSPAYTQTTWCSRSGSESFGACGENVCCLRYCLIFSFAAALEMLLVRLSENEVILEGTIYLAVNRVKRAEAPRECVRRAVCEMLHADDAIVVSWSPDGLARITTIKVRVFGPWD